MIRLKLNSLNLSARVKVPFHKEPLTNPMERRQLTRERTRIRSQVLIPALLNVPFLPPDATVSFEPNAPLKSTGSSKTSSKESGKT